MLFLWCLSPTLVSPAKTNTLLGGILGQTEETLQRGRLGHAGSGAEPQPKGRAGVQHPPKPLGLTARGRLKGNREGPGAQALPCTAGHWRAVHAECPVQERLLPPGQWPQPGPMCSEGS